MKKHTTGTIIVDGVPYNADMVFDFPTLLEGTTIGIPRSQCPDGKPPSVAWVIFDEELADYMDPPDQAKPTPEELAAAESREAVIDAAIELAYTDFDGRRHGYGKYSGRGARTEREAFQWAVRDVIAFAENNLNIRGRV